MTPVGYSAAPGGSARASRGLLFRPDIQGLRAVAVLLVVAQHLFRRPSGGFVGVDVFLVISGYLITGLLVREGERRGRPSLRVFYARRVRRILPAAALALVTTNLIAGHVLSRLQARQLRADSLWAALFGANIRFSQIGTDYFQHSRPPSAVQHFWSLSVEEQFYLVWPVLVIAAFLLSRTHRWPGRGWVLPLATVAAVGSVVSFAWCLHLTADNPVAAYFSTTARAWELGMGALLSVGQARATAVPERVRTGLAWTGLAAIVVAATQYDAHTPFPGTAALLPALGAALVLGSNDPRRGPGRVGLLNGRPARYVGDLSYSLYLWHFPCLVLAGAWFGSSGATFYVFAGLLPFALAAATYHLVESRVRQSLWLLEKPAGWKRRTAHEAWVFHRRAAGALLGTASLLAGLLAGLAMLTPRPAGARALGPASTAVGAALRATSWGSLTPDPVDLPDAGAPQMLRDKCLDVTDRNVTRCAFGNLASSRLVVVVGDSMAASWVPGLLRAFPASRLQMLTMSNCPVVDALLEDELGTTRPRCLVHNTWVDAQIRRLNPTMVVDSGMAWNFVTLMAGRSHNGVVNQLAWRDARERALRVLMQQSSAALVLVGAPPGGSNIQTCFRPGSRPQDCQSHEPRVWGLTAATEKQVAATLGARYVDPGPWLCQDGWCPAAIGDAVVYWDGYHLTRVMSEQLAPQLLQALG